MSTISMELVKKLRDKTQVGMMDCKKALEQAQGDFEQAVEILRKKGAAVAAKRADNITNHGRIESFLNADNTLGVLVETACETDFSANTDAMKQFVLDVAHHIAQQNSSSVETLLKETLVKNTKISVQQLLDELVAKICENTKINRFVRFAVTGNGLINIYIHPGSTVGVMVELATDKAVQAHREALLALAKDICMQIAVNNPVCVLPNDLDPQLIEKERTLAQEQLATSGKPAAVIEKIIQGKLEKFYQDACLMNQAFIKNDKITVKQYVADTAKGLGLTVTIKQFKRFAIGR
jgi:elongation factor Ts